MKHYGDITKLNGADIEPVDVLTGGSPCQDLSVAGKRAGLDGERSGLFMEQIRIAKEMRENDILNGRTGDAIRPRFIIWENVPGAFSSNRGEDFRVVLEEFCRIREAEFTVPRCKNNKWTKAGFIAGDDWSIAWRTMDAQYWGVPQRRKRIALVMDTNGQRAGKILFEQTGSSGNPSESIEPWKGIARNPEDGIGRDSFTLKVRGEGSKTLNSIATDSDHCPIVIVLEHNPSDARIKIDNSGHIQTLKSRMGTGGGQVPLVMINEGDSNENDS